jgi:hypothetical protein
MMGSASLAQKKVGEHTGVKGPIDALKQVAHHKRLGSKQAKYLGSWVGTRGVAAAGVPLVAVGAQNLLTKKPKPVEAPDIKEDVLGESVRRVTHQKKNPLKSVSKMAANDAAINTLAQREQRDLVRRKKKQTRYSLTSAALGATALGLQSPRLAGVAVRRSSRLANVKPIKRIAEIAPKSTNLSSTVGVGSLGVGSVGSLNYARINRSETKADQRSATALKVKKAEHPKIKEIRDREWAKRPHETGARTPHEPRPKPPLEGSMAWHRTGPGGRWEHDPLRNRKSKKPLPRAVRLDFKTGERTVYHDPVAKMGEVDADKYLDSKKGKTLPYGAQRTLQDVDDYYRIAHGGRSKAQRIEHFMDKNINPAKAHAKQRKVVEEIGNRRTIESAINRQNFIRHASGGKDPSDHDFAVADELGRRRKAGLPEAAKLRSKTEIRNLKARQAHFAESRVTGKRIAPRQPDPHEESDQGFRDFGPKFYRQNPHPQLGNPYKNMSPHYRRQLDQVRKPAKQHLSGNRARQVDVAKALLRVPKFPRRPPGFAGVKVGGLRTIRNPYTGMQRQVTVRGSVG